MNCVGYTEVTESFYLETREGLFFAVKGSEYPPDRWIAVLRYAPDPEQGDRAKDGKIYRRLYRFSEQEHFLRAFHPQYLAFDPVFQTTLQSVPRSLVQRVYDPRLRLLELQQAPVRNGVEEDAVAFMRLLRRESGVPWSALGITGSLLAGLNTELSDLDVAVFGTQNCRKVHQALQRLLDSPARAEVRRFDAKGLEALYAERAVDTHMDFQDFVNLEKRKVNQGMFRDRAYFVRFIKAAHEAGDSYGRLRYTPLGRATITASIADAREAIFTPCRYRVFDVCGMKGSGTDVREIVSFRGRFCGQAREGESVTATGTLERVQSVSGGAWHRVLVGNHPGDTMVVRR